MKLHYILSKVKIYTNYITHRTKLLTLDEY